MPKFRNTPYAPQSSRHPGRLTIPPTLPVARIPHAAYARTVAPVWAAIVPTWDENAGCELRSPKMPSCCARA